MKTKDKADKHVPAKLNRAVKGKKKSAGKNKGKGGRLKKVAMVRSVVSVFENAPKEVFNTASSTDTALDRRTLCLLLISF